MPTISLSRLKSSLAAALTALTLAGCAMLPHPTRSMHAGEEGPAGKCADFFAAVDRSVGNAHSMDPGAFRVSGHPYLRVDRFLASFSGEVSDRAAFSAWVDRMQNLDREARRYEIANTPEIIGSVPGAVVDADALQSKVSSCGDLLREADFRDPASRSALAESVKAPDDYIVLRRVLGIYPLTRMFISMGVSRWHEQEREKFSNRPPAGWKTRRYLPESAGEIDAVERAVQRTPRDALGIPQYSGQTLQRMFGRYAPVWEIQDGGWADSIGAPYWGAAGRLAVDTAAPVTYTLLSFSRFQDSILTQLNYIVWFPARPKQHPLDILGGFLDGVIYRVTLDGEGAPLLYETVHSCGCYYKAYPGGRIEPREEIDYAEPPLILTAPRLDPVRQVMTIALEARTHYVRHLYPTGRRTGGNEAGRRYAFADYGQLRSLAWEQKRRKSMFGQDSLVDGSQRLERLILWPTGVLSPGAMRQWGRHAVAFAGRRHFDDPFYLDRMFRLKAVGP